MLPGVKNVIKDGAIGVLGADATGVFAAVGVAAKHGGEVLTLSDPGTVEDKIGGGPLRDLIVSALSIARTTVYALPLEGTTAGVLSAVTAGDKNTGKGTLTVSGSPRNEYDIEVELLSAGGLNDATFRVSVDGSVGRRLTVPNAPGTYAVPDTGVTITFDALAGAFSKGDTFSFSATAPRATNAEVLAGIDKVIAQKRAIEWIAVAGVSDAALWTALASKAESAAGSYQYLFFIAQARLKRTNETVDQWVNALTGGERGTATSSRLQVCAGWVKEADPGGQVDVRGLIGTYCGKLAARGVHQGPDAVRYGPITAAKSLAPEGLTDGQIESLKDAGYVTARTIIGLTGIYVTSGEMMSEEGSDYDIVERRRTMDKACRQVRAAQLVWVNDTAKVGADGSPEGVEMLVAQSENPLQIMVTAGEISSGAVVVPDGQNILSTKKLKTKVRIVPLGKLTYIENEIAFSNPALGGQQ